MDKYIIYTMGIKEINEAVQRVLFEKGYRWAGSKDQNLSCVNDIYYLVLGEGGSGDIKMGLVPKGPDYRELTFRQLTELPPVHDEEGELAEHILKAIEDYWDGNISGEIFDGWKKKQNWCKIRQKVEKKLKLGLSDAET